MSRRRKAMITRSLNGLFVLLLLAIILSPASGSQANGVWTNFDKSSEYERPQASQQKVKTEESATEERNGERWFSRGYQLHSADRYPEAIEAFKHSVDLGYRKATAMYNIA